MSKKPHRPLHDPNDQPTRALPTEAEVAEALTSGWFEGLDEFGKYGPQFDPLSAARAVLALFAAQPTVAQVKAEAWDEGYGTGVHDERTAAEVAWPEYREPGRVNPYRTERRDHA